MKKIVIGLETVFSVKYKSDKNEANLELNKLHIYDGR